MLLIDYKSGLPIYEQVYNGILRLADIGALKPGDQLPSVRALAMELGVNPNTIQKAYQILETNGIIYSVKGKGSFISDDAAADTAVIMSAKRDFRAAVSSAAELGLRKPELIEIVSEMFEKEGDAK